MSKITYKSAGVDIEKADEFVNNIKSMVYKSALSKVPAFGALFDLAPILKKYKNPVLVSSTDGVGTKLLIAQKLGVHNTVGIDLVGMNVNDVVCMGAQPLFFLDYIGCGKVEPKILAEVMFGVHKGLQEADCVLIGGETAEMPGMYNPNEYDLAGFCVGAVDKNKIINGTKIKPGNVIIGVESNGLHSNGFSLARKVLGKDGIVRHSYELLKPTRIYVRMLMNLLKTIPQGVVKGIAHITGGAFYNKAIKILPDGVGMEINKKSWPVPEIFKIIQTQGNIDEQEMYTVLNMGIGLIAVVDSAYAKKALTILNKFYPAYNIGFITKGGTKLDLV